MEPILCGIETEYGFQVEGKGAEDQIDESAALVRSYSDERVSFWNYRYESPRSDLRGFQLEKLAYDPIDAKFDAGRRSGADDRADQILANGARFYNDHGHPEYATPECNDAFQCAIQDRVGEFAVLTAARNYEASTGRQVRLYKNNTDFHGASYGTHESYCLPRELSWETLYRSVLPILLFRPILCGAGKVGAESGEPCQFQMSQRADFFVEPINAETLYRRPIFNTRDEAHADPSRWMRLHVIAGDANMSLKCTARKVALIKLAVQLAIVDRAPKWDFRNPVEVAKRVSRDLEGKAQFELAGGGMATAIDIFESYFVAAENQGWMQVADAIGPDRQQDPYLAPFLELFVVHECRDLLSAWRDDPEEFQRHVDWASKKRMLDMFAADAGEWNAVQMCALDLEYSNVERSESLYWAMVQEGQVDDADLPGDYANSQLNSNSSTTRSEIRSYAIRNYREFLVDACWRTLTFEVNGSRIEVELPPDWRGSLTGATFFGVESFIEWIRNQDDHQSR